MSARRKFGKGREIIVQLPTMIAIEDALDCGDTILAADIVSGILREAEPRRASRRRAVCPCCGTSFPFPGLLDVHALRCSCDEDQAA